MLTLQEIFANAGVRERVGALLDAPRGVMAVTGAEFSGKNSTLLSLASMLRERGHRLTFVRTDPEIEKLSFFAELALAPHELVRIADVDSELEPALAQAASRGIVVVDQMNESTAPGIAAIAETGAIVLTRIATPFVGLDCAYTIGRLRIDSGRFLALFSCLVSQVLLPNLCPHCREPVVLDELASQAIDPGATAPMQVWREVGCDKCGSGGAYTGPPGTRWYQSLNEVVLIDDTTRPVFARYLEQGSLDNPLPEDHLTLTQLARDMLKRGDLGVETFRREITQNPLLRMQHHWEMERRHSADARGRIARLRRFFSPAVAELIVSGAVDDPMKSRRREIVVAFLDLRGFTAFAETSDPEDVMRILREYHAAMGELITRHGATLERFAGDGMMIFLNDPVPVENPALDAVTMAVAMQKRFEDVRRGWRKRGMDLGMGIGIAQGYATIGAIGYEDRRDYAAIGVATNLAARLCGEAADGQILLSQRVAGEVEATIAAQPVGALALKGFHSPVPAFAVDWKEAVQ